MRGGTGNDTYIVDDFLDIVDETGGGGVDSVLASCDFTIGPSGILIGFEFSVAKTFAAKMTTGFSSGVENLTLTGTGNFAGTGNSADNRIVGNAGANSLAGLTGKDTLTGAGRPDTFFFTDKVKKANLDHITDFTPGTDKIALIHEVFTKLNLGDLSKKAFFAHKHADEAKDHKDRIVYDTKSGELYYDKDGKGGTDAKPFAVLDGAPNIDQSDFVILPS